MRIVGYTRVSTSRQAEGASVEAQEEAIRKWAEGRGHKVVGVYQDDGKPGTLEEVNRPGLLEALNIVEAVTQMRW
jgi:site-specific DNA recombinase